MRRSTAACWYSSGPRHDDPRHLQWKTVHHGPGPTTRIYWAHRPFPTRPTIPASTRLFRPPGSVQHGWRHRFQGYPHRGCGYGDSGSRSLRSDRGARRPIAARPFKGHHRPTEHPGQELLFCRQEVYGPQPARRPILTTRPRDLLSCTGSSDVYLLAAEACFKAGDNVDAAIYTQRHPRKGRLQGLADSPRRIAASADGGRAPRRLRWTLSSTKGLGSSTPKGCAGSTWRVRSPSMNGSSNGTPSRRAPISRPFIS